VRGVSNSALASVDTVLGSDAAIHSSSSQITSLESIFTAPRVFVSTLMGTRLSGLARQALSLHRALLRAARRKSPEARAGIETAIRAEFERHRHLDPRDLQAVEHRIRAGRKKLALIDDPNVVAASGTSI
jgi:succinate dehydrogenase assembly factor 1